jgi:exodeoxyribonuclease VII large subunit
MPQTVYAVSELTEILRALIEDTLPSVWVEGEISNLSRPSSGHWYFTLKDGQAQIRCAMFRKANFLVRPVPRDGDQVRVRARPSVYVARGDLQLICDAMEPAGQGALLLAYERLRARLQAEGLFDAALKRPIPSAPRRIGLITSATGAAVHDVLTALRRRFALGSVVLYPVPVQGAEAAPAIVKALKRLPEQADVDVVLLVRGGGSLEDLWAFNEEAVARAIRACIRPVIVGVGHEVDFTIADFAADLRAPTPTAAAELASPNTDDWRRRIDGAAQMIQRVQQQRLKQAGEQLARLSQRLLQQHPGRRLRERAQRLDEHEMRLRTRQRQHLETLRQRLRHLQQRLASLNLRDRIGRASAQCRGAEDRLQLALQQRLVRQRQRLQAAETLLGSLNPQAVLERGYAIARDSHGAILRSPEQVKPRDDVELQLAAGSLRLTRLI